MIATTLSAAAQGFGLSAGLIIAIGAQNAHVLRCGIRRRHVLAVTTLCFVIDVALIAVGVGGFGALVAAFPRLTRVAAWGGAIFLVGYGALALKAAIRPKALRPADADGPGLGGAVATTLAVSLLNPHVYLDTVVLIGSVAGQHPPDARLAFGIGAASASLIWFYGLGFGAGRLAPVFARPTAWRVLDLAIAAIMFSIAAGLVWSELH